MDECDLKPHQKMASEISISYRHVYELFESILRRNPEKTFVICPGKVVQKYSYREFESHTQKFSQFLCCISDDQLMRVCLVAPNSAEFLFIYFAALCLGITIVPINPMLSADEITYIIKDSDAQLVLFSSTVENKIKLNSTNASCKFQCIELVDEAGVAESLQENSYKNRSIKPTDEAVIIYTSGTTGRPKGVVLTHLNLLSDSKALCDHFQFDSNTRTLCVLPLFHNNGQITTLLAPLWAGGSVVIARGAAILVTFWALVEKYKVTFSSVMTSILSILLAQNKENKSNTLKAILCGGQVLTESIQKDFEDRFEVPIFEGYGLTETTSFACINGYPKENRRTGSIGRPLYVNSMAILDDSETEVGPDVEGEICIKGFNVANEYLNLPAENKKSFRDGWFHSGDYGRVDADGYFIFHGRKDSLIIKGGENIYPSEVENILYQHPAVDECAVIGIPDALLGEEIAAFVKLADSCNLDAVELKAFCRNKIAGFKQPKVIIIINDLPDIDEIPKGPTKKILYRKLKSYYLANIT